MNFAIPADHRLKLKESEKKKKKKKGKYLNWKKTKQKQTNKRTMEHESDVYTNCNWYTWHSHQMIEKGFGDYPNENIIKIGQNSEKSPGNFRRFAVSQTPVKIAKK